MLETLLDDCHNGSLRKKLIGNRRHRQLHPHDPFTPYRCDAGQLGDLASKYKCVR